MEINSSPFGNSEMSLKNFNEIFGLTQSKQDISFLPSGDDLLSQTPNQSYSKFASQHDRFSNQNGQTTDQAPKQTTDQAPKTSDQSVKQTADVTQVSERPARQQPHSEKRNTRIGALEYGLDEKGDPITITGTRGEFFYKGSDGKWVQHMPPDRERTVENLLVDNEGNMEFDVVSNGYKVHHERNVDGSHSVDSKEYGGKLVYDKNGNLTEAPAGDGHTRKFHYDKDGQLDKIDGRLGQWERKVEQGKVVWVNDKGVRWEGEMRVNPKTNDLEFRGGNGVAWNFTTHGKDVPVYSR